VDVHNSIRSFTAQAMLHFRRRLLSVGICFLVLHAVILLVLKYVDPKRTIERGSSDSRQTPMTSVGGLLSFPHSLSLADIFVLPFLVCNAEN